MRSPIRCAVRCRITGNHAGVAAIRSCTFGALAGTVIGFWIFFVPTEEFRNGQLNEGAYAPFAATLAVLMMLTIFCSAYGTRAVIPYLPKAPPQTPISVTGILRRTLTDIAAAMRCGSLRWLFGVARFMGWFPEIAGFALDLISWPRGTHVKTAADVPADVIAEVGMLYGPYVAGCGIFSVLSYTRYELTRERHAEILAELYARRRGAPVLKAAS